VIRIVITETTKETYIERVNYLVKSTPTEVKEEETDRYGGGTKCTVPSTRMSGFGLARPQLSTAFQKLSVDEHMFILHIYTWGLIQAKRIAALCDYKLQRPLPELLAMTSELDKNYSARSAKRMECIEEYKTEDVTKERNVSTELLEQNVPSESFNLKAVIKAINGLT
jgi:hypothetical protein